MKKKELIRELRKCKYCFGYIAYSQHDGAYIPIVKSVFIDFIKGIDDDEYKYNARVQGDDLYIG